MLICGTSGDLFSGVIGLLVTLETAAVARLAGIRSHVAVTASGISDKKDSDQAGKHGGDQGCAGDSILLHRRPETRIPQRSALAATHISG